MPDLHENIPDRIRHLGVRSVSLVDLCAAGFSRSEEDCRSGQEMAQRIARRLDRLSALSDLPYEMLRDEAGIEGFEALRALALVELGRRTGLAGKGEVEVIEGPGDIFILLADLMQEKREHFYAILLDSANGVMRKALIHIGTLNMSIVGAREIFREAIRDGAASVIVAHNHPSGDPTPSPEDVDVTEKLVEAGQLLDIPVLDHVIIGNRDYRSLKELGLM